MNSPPRAPQARREEIECVEPERDRLLEALAGLEEVVYSMSPDARSVPLGPDDRIRRALDADDLRRRGIRELLDKPFRLDALGEVVHWQLASTV